jgi:hypothetical protein
VVIGEVTTTTITTEAMEVTTILIGVMEEDMDIIEEDMDITDKSFLSQSSAAFL